MTFDSRLNKKKTGANEELIEEHKEKQAESYRCIGPEAQMGWCIQGRAGGPERVGGQWRGRAIGNCVGKGSKDQIMADPSGVNETLRFYLECGEKHWTV